MIIAKLLVLYRINLAYQPARAIVPWEDSWMHMTGWPKVVQPQVVLFIQNIHLTHLKGSFNLDIGFLKNFTKIQKGQNDKF